MAALRMIGLTRKSRGEDEGTHADQRARIESRVAVEPGMVLVRVEQEHKVSGGKDWQTRAIGRAVADVAAGNADGIIVAYEDRISREGLEAAVAIWRALADAGAVFIACDGVDTRVEGAEFVFNLKAAVAAEQLRLYRVRSNAGRGKSVTEHGVHGGSTAPLGYVFSTRVKAGTGDTAHGSLALAPVDASRVHDAFVVAASASDSERSWANVRRALGVASHGNAAAIIANRVYLGEARSGDFVTPNAHPAIVDEETFKRANRPRKQNGGGRVRGAYKGHADALLAQCLTCGTCGWSMHRDGAGTPGEHYRCKNLACEASASISRRMIDPYVLRAAQVVHAMLNPLHELDEALDAAAVPAFAEALFDAEAQLAEVEAAHAAGELSPLAYGKALTAAETARDAARASLYDAESSRGWLGMSSDTVAARLLDADGNVTDTAEARGFIREMVTVTVYPLGDLRRHKIACDTVLTSGHRRVEVEPRTVRVSDGGAVAGVVSAVGFGLDVEVPV